MSRRFEELDWQQTPIGAISLRRRFDPALHVDVYEVKLDDEFLMSSLFTVAEIELATIALAELPADAAAEPPADAAAEPAGDAAAGGLDVVVGGLGLGYTARTVLRDPRVRSLTVVEALGEVIEWHRKGLLPYAAELTSDPRSRLVHGDFFALVGGDAGLDPDTPARRFHAVLVDIDHSPRHLLHPGHAGFYRPEGLRRLAGQLHPGGVFALWSNDPPDDEFGAVLAEVFPSSRAEVVSFPNPLQGRDAANTIYVGRLAADLPPTGDG